MGFQGLVCGSAFAIGCALGTERIEDDILAEYDDGLSAGRWLQLSSTIAAPRNWTIVSG